ncbi:hypothetical protein E2C01_089936 [Portunus trituberculatus]|uniref:Uncharacterized protein n=1 Tax=Portunus trituberculatus TaxID=210409 RepID=A0A5B7JEW4_PORTR|nr:hypothetical protein [Portunus trituberculatus]
MTELEQAETRRDETRREETRQDRTGPGFTNSPAFFPPFLAFIPQSTGVKAPELIESGCNEWQDNADSLI